MKTKTTREPVATGSLRARAATLRLPSARHNGNCVRGAQARLSKPRSAQPYCTYAKKQRGYALIGGAFVVSVEKHKLSRLLRLVLPPLDWSPPRSAVEFIELLAELVTNWTIPSLDLSQYQGRLHAGERYRGIRASDGDVAEVLGVSAGEWAREPFRRKKLVARGGAREWAVHHGFVAYFAMPWAEDEYYYEPGPALLALLPSGGGGQ